MSNCIQSYSWEQNKVNVYQVRYSRGSLAVLRKFAPWYGRGSLTVPSRFACGTVAVRLRYGRSLFEVLATQYGSKMLDVRSTCHAPMPLQASFFLRAPFHSVCNSRRAALRELQRILSKFARGTVEVRTRYCCGSLEVPRRFARGTAEVRSWYGRGSLVYGTAAIRYLNFLLLPT